MSDAHSYYRKEALSCTYRITVELEDLLQTLQLCPSVGDGGVAETVITLSNTLSLLKLKLEAQVV